MPRTHRIPLLAWPLLGAALFLPGSVANAGPTTLRVHAQVPRPPDDLDALERMGKAPQWQGGVQIPYATLESELNTLLKKAVGKKKKGTAVCTDPCADIDWTIKLTPKAKFTEKGQPKLKLAQRGKSVEVSVISRLRIDVHADVHAETWASDTDFDVDAFVEIGADVRATISVWPKLKVDVSKTTVILVDTDLNLELDGAAAEMGEEIGMAIGSTPFGIMGGGPLAVGGTLALFGDAAADVAEKQIEAIYRKRVEKAFEEMTPKLISELQQRIDMGVETVDDLMADTYAAPLPGIGKSVAQLSDDFGATLQLFSAAGSGFLRVSAVARFDGKPGTGKVTAQILIPTAVSKCVSSGGMTLPVGLEPVNEDLDAKIGTSCTALLGPKGRSRQAGVATQVYLGADPQTALGKKATKLASWKTAGSVKYVGTLQKAADGSHYTCKAQVSKLPDAAFIEVAANGRVAERLQVGDTAPTRRYAIYSEAGTTAVLDDAWKPGKVQVVGGGRCGASGTPPVLTPSQATEFIQFLENCPECGVRRLNSDPNTLTIDNLSALKADPVGKMVMKKLKAMKKAAKRAPR